MVVYLKALVDDGGQRQALRPPVSETNGTLAQVLLEAAVGLPRPQAEPRYPAVIQLDEYTDIVVGLTQRQECQKRILDLVLSIIFGLLALPLIAIVALAIWLTSGRPILFRQQRIGRNGRTFVLLKFRTMRVDAEEMLATDTQLCNLYRSNGFKIPTDADPRVTDIGRLLRTTSLDELPQLWNILRGDMSLVGPRPVVPAELPEYHQLASLYCASRPGLTGEWQIHGRDQVMFPERALTELTSLCDWSVWSDLRTIILTIPAVIRGAR